MKIMFVVFICLFFGARCFASATANEFVPCKKVSEAKRKHCFTAGGFKCDETSKQELDLCKKRIIKSHNIDPVRIKIEQKTRKKKLKDKANEKSKKGTHLSSNKNSITPVS